MPANPVSLPRADPSSHPAPHRERVSIVSALAGLLLAPAAWFVQLNLDVVLASNACYPKDVPLAAPTLPTLVTVILLAQVVALVLAAAGALIAWRDWRRTVGERPGPAHYLLESGDGRTRFLAMAGLLGSSLFFLSILFSIVSLAAGQGCGG